MAAGTVSLKIDGAIARVTLSNPARFNAMSLSMWKQLGEAVANAGDSPDVRVVLLRGEGNKAFVSGADISEFESERSSPEGVAAHDRVVAGSQQAVIDCQKPVVACIHGICMGGGMGLALACDLRYAARDARFRMPAARIGVGYALDMMCHLVDAVGAARAADLFYTARTFDGIEAERIGMVHRTCEAAELDAVAERTAAMIAENAPLSIQAAKLSIRYWQADPALRDHAAVERALLRCANSHDYAEGHRAFMEKRRPRPQSPGGATDFAGRVLAQKLSVALGQQVVVENRPGAAGNIGTDAVAKSPPDGYTILLAALASVAVAPHLYKSLPFDPAKDFTPVTVVANALHVLVVPPALPLKTVPELVAYAKANPDKLSFGSPGNGEAGHLAGELFKTMTGAPLLHVPYKGGAPAMTGLLGGQVQMIFATVTTAISHIQSGTLRALAMTGGHRFEGLPDVPTIAESGVPGYEVNNWLGVFIPAGTPPAIVNKLNAELGKALEAADVKTKFTASGLEAVWMTPEQFAAYVKSETVKWGKVVRDAGATAD